VTVRIDSETGKRAGEDTVNSRFEVFRSEFAPGEKNVDGAGDSPVYESVQDQPENQEEIVDDIF